MGEVSPRAMMAKKRIASFNPNESIATGKNTMISTSNTTNKDNESSISKSVSFLSADSVRWMNKHQPNAKNSTRGHVLPTKALQLRDVFRGLDYANQGFISIEQMKEAILYVASASAANGEQSLFKDPHKMIEFFTAMDINHDGTVDFNEFLLGMTLQSRLGQESSNGEGNNEVERLQEAFFDFAIQHRRTKILDSVAASNASNANKTDLEKYHELKQLFSIQYFRDEHIDLSVSDKLTRVQDEVNQQMKEIRSKEYLQQRRREQMRAREAALYFKDVKKKQFIAEEMKRLKIVTKPDNTFPMTSLIPGEGIDTEKIQAKAEMTIRKRFAQFALHDEHTFTPAAMSDRLKPVNIHRLAQQEVNAIKAQKYLVSNVPVILPPIPLAQRLRPITNDAAETPMMSKSSKY